MLKKNKRLLIVTTVVLLVPILTGLLLWNQLPEQIPTHWNAEGEIDGYSCRAFAVFAIPGFLILCHWLCVLATAADPKAKGHHPKVLQLVLWICPVISLLITGLIYPTALGYDTFFSAPLFVSLLMGLLFIIIGNYLPKCKQNYTVGIKLPWTLNNEENWNKTHRFAGWLWIIGGFLVMAAGLIGILWLMIPVLLAMVLIPTLYSCLLYRKQKKTAAD